MLARGGRLVALLAALAISGSAVPAYPLDPATPLDQYARASWTENDGLPSSLIWAIAQDHEGYLWLGTDGGLIRFDGVRFVPLGDLVDVELPNTSVYGLLTSRDGSLWIAFGSTGGVARLQSGTLTSYTEDDGLPLGVSNLLEDRDGTIWAGGRGGLSRFRDGVWQRVGARNGLEPQTVTGLFLDRSGALWVAGAQTLFRRSAGASSFALVSAPFLVRGLAEDASGTLWGVSPFQAAGRLDARQLDAAVVPYRDVNGWRIAADRNGNLWVATLGRGLLRIAFGRDGRSTVEQFDADHGLTSNAVRSLFEDREGNIWAGTQSGLTRFTDTTVTAISSKTAIGQPVRALTTAQDGSVWVGTDDGIYVFGERGSTRYGRHHGLASVTIGALHRDSAGVMWVAMDQGGVARFENGRFVTVPLPVETGTQRVWAMTSERDGTLWLCDAGRGVFRLTEGRIDTLQQYPQLHGKSAIAAMTDSAGRVWLGLTEGTIAVYEKQRLRMFGPGEGVDGGAVSVVYEDREGAIWAGTAKGLAQLVGDRFVFVPKRVGLPNGNVRAIVEDDNGYLWLGLGSNILRASIAHLKEAVQGTKESVSYVMYDKSDGVPGAPMSVGGYPTAGRSSDGRIWFLTNNGLAVLDPGRLSKHRLPPPVLIERAIVNDRSSPPTPELQMAPRTSRVQIDYTGLSFSAPSKVRFRYQLEGFDTEWVDAGTRRQAFYTNLPPGPYTFRVIAENDGVWNNEGDRWEFSITPAFYQTGWARAAAVLTTSCIVLLAWQVRARQVRRQFALVLAERARMAREVHDTLLQSLVGLAFQFDTLAEEVHTSPDVAVKRVARLREHVEMYIREARQSIWELRSPSLKSSDLPTALRGLGERIAGSAVRFELVTSGNHIQQNYSTDEALLRIGQEAISNAVRHARATRVTALLSYESREVTLRVSDDGQGFDPAGSTNEQHCGLETMRERIQQIGGTFRLITSPGQGTTIEVSAPARGKER